MRYRASIYIDYYADNENDAQIIAEAARERMAKTPYVTFTYVGKVDEYENLKK